jgi:PHD/YefM family antitoxin component YafN of YafNO toxin-antitoxin module
LERIFILNFYKIFCILTKKIEDIIILTKTKKRNIKKPEIIYRDNKPVSVIIDLDDYKIMLERLDDIEDMEYISNIQKETLKFRKLDDFLADMN